MASDSLLNVIQGLVKREDRIAKEEDKKAKEKLKLEKEKEEGEDDEDEDPVGDPAANQPPADEPPPEAEPAPGEPEAEPEAPPQDTAPEPEAEPEPEDDGAGDTKPTGPDPVLVDQVTNAVMAQIMTILQDASKEQEAQKDTEVKLSGKKEKINTKPKMEAKQERKSFREAIHLSVTDGTPLSEGYESDVLEILQDEGIDGPLGYEPFFEKGKLYVEKGSEKKAEKVLKQSRDIRKVPKIVGEENILESLPMEAVEVDARFKGFKEALKRLTYEKTKKKMQEEDKQKKYQAFVSVMLKKFGVESPAELEVEKKKAYFDALDKGWEAEDEEPEPEDKKKSENVEIKEASGTDAVIGGLALAGGLWALKKAWDKWGANSTLNVFKSKADKNKDILQKRKDADDAKADADELERQDHEKEFGSAADAQADYDQDIQDVGPEKAKTMIAKGYSLDPEDDTKVMPSKQAAAKEKSMKAKKQADRSRQGGLGVVDKDKQADLKAKIKKKRADAGKEEFFNFTKDQLSELNNDKIKTQLLEELVLEGTMTLEESIELQAIMALDDAGVKADINRKGQVVIKKKDKKKAHRALEKSFPKGGWPTLKLEDTSAYNVVSRARNRLMESVDAEAERELYLYIKDGRHFQKQIDSIVKNIVRKKKSGKYDHTKAPQLWLYLVDNGAKQYAKDFGGNANVMFPKDSRKSVALQFTDEYEAEIDKGLHS